MKIKMREVRDEVYEGEGGLRMEREHGLTPNGNPMGGRWVLRDKDGKLVDFDQYRNDLAERNDLDIWSRERAAHA